MTKKLLAVLFVMFVLALSACAPQTTAVAPAEEQYQPTPEFQEAVTYICSELSADERVVAEKAEVVKQVCQDTLYAWEELPGTELHGNPPQAEIDAFANHLIGGLRKRFCISGTPYQEGLLKTNLIATINTARQQYVQISGEKK